MSKVPVPPPDDAQLLKLEEVAYLLDLPSDIPVRQLIDRGKLGFIKVIGAIVRVERVEVERYARSLRPIGHPEAEAEFRRAELRRMVKADWNTGEDPFEEKSKRRKKLS